MSAGTTDNTETLLAVDKIPSRPWILSNQYGLRFVLSDDNEIVLGTKTFEYLGEETIRFIVDAVNAVVKEERKN